MTDTMTAFNTLIDNYIDARDSFGRERTLKSLRRHYIDSCSEGDQVICKLINLLEQELPATDMAGVDEDATYFATHITEVIEYWLKEGKPCPNPWWAS
jgi:hypothetical protein